MILREATNWTPGVIATVAAAVLAIVFVVLSRRGKALPPSAPVKDDKLLDFDRQIQNAVDALREHSAEASRLSPEEFQAQKTELELAAARAMKARDEYVAKGKPQAKSKPAPTATGFWATHPGLRGALIGGLAVGFFVVLGLVLTQEEKQRNDGMEATGKTPSQGTETVSAEERAEEEHFQAAMERVKKNPEDVESLAEMTHALLRRQQFDEADALTERGIGVDPFHTETRIHRAMLKGAKGDLQASVKELEHLANIYPDAHEALLFAGAISMELNDNKRALRNFERFAAEAPREEQLPQIYSSIAALRAQVGE